MLMAGALAGRQFFTIRQVSKYLLDYLESGLARIKYIPINIIQVNVILEEWAS